MRGLTQDLPLTVGTLLPYAADTFGAVEVVSCDGPGRLLRLNYAQVAERARRMAAALLGLGLRQGDMVSSLAFNTHRQFELFHATAQSGTVLHTANPRLAPEQLAYTINHAGASVLFCDLDGLAIAEALAGQLPALRRTVVMCDVDAMPASTALPDPVCYEALLASGDVAARLPPVDERDAACLCYTSGTTGRPKGALYSHRGCVLSAMSMIQPNAWSIGARDSILAIAPLFHCNGWAAPFIAPMTGAKLVLPGRDLSSKRLVDLINTERITFTQGVPTIWQGVIEHLRATGQRIDSLRRVVCGGSAPPLAMIEALERDYGVRVIPAWGMTETTHGTSTAVPHPDVSPERKREILSGIGRSLYGVEMRVIGDDGKAVARDGRNPGHVQVRGHWVVSQYFKAEGGQILDDEGWMWTGDVGVIDAEAYLRLTDRAKDLIKSGGEWISSIELENLAAGHPAVAQAAAVARPHPKWGERPVLAVVKREGAIATGADILDWLRPKLPKWWLPDDVVFLSELPLTGTGKVRKADLRAMLAARVKAE
jgi:3-(methylthio)propionyl---CoA ligase